MFGARTKLMDTLVYPTDELPDRAPRIRATLSPAARWTSYGAWLTLAGALLSGPVALVVVELVAPEPEWRDTATFVAHYSRWQSLPFFLGFALVAGLVTLVAGLHELAPAELKPRSTVALALAAAFSALVFLNYTVQTTFVPLLVSTYREADAPVLGAFTMTNPRSLGWCLEMWAYGVAGVATWLVAPVFRNHGVERAARWAFVVNGPTSIGSALATAFLPGWALTLPGLAAFLVWNVLVVAMSVLALVAVRTRTASAARVSVSKGHA
jgi:hypothetical protein